ncbi:TIR domain-containing protein [Rathayibacter festucae]|uniref:TIR domain-containing protein n=1 Tax=Rathayibacter festucae TaxID=110937 RepID=UPI001FB3D749|nr:TIR domain-containing protein [Rathayibacter festucae]MCJ1699836.1 TIR domain-containing protein [Rathayibacter festucae]
MALSGSGFWSYVHANDDAEDGRISQLARDVAAQYTLQTDDTIDLFLDRDNLGWGDDWRATVDESLSSVAFFVPVVTPSYFQRPECRRELEFFARRAERLGVKELVLPIRYVDFPLLHEENPSDELVALIQRFQWEDWTSLRFSARSDPDYRRAVAALATRLVEANEAANRAVAVGSVLAGIEREEAEDEPGSLDKLVAMEIGLTDATEAMAGVGETIGEISLLMQAATADLKLADSQAKPLAARLTAARKLSKALSEPAGRVKELGSKYASSLHDVDGGVRVIVAQAPSEVAEKPDTRETFIDFFDTVRESVGKSESALDAAQSMVDNLAPMEKTSRDLRPPLRTLREGVTRLIEGRDIMRGWVAVINASTLE